VAGSRRIGARHRHHGPRPGWPRVRLGLGIVALLLALPGGARAQEPDAELTQLRRQVEELKAAVARLDTQLQRVEGGRKADSTTALPVPAAPAPPPAVPPAVPPSATPFSAAENATLHKEARIAQALQGWGELRNGLSQDEVRSRLGEPQSILPVANRTGWVYRYGQGAAGSVFFDHAGKVISLMAPGQGPLHLY